MIAGHVFNPDALDIKCLHFSADQSQKKETKEQENDQQNQASDGFLRYLTCMPEASEPDSQPGSIVLFCFVFLIIVGSKAKLAGLPFRKKILQKHDILFDDYTIKGDFKAKVFWKIFLAEKKESTGSLIKPT